MRQSSFLALLPLLATLALVAPAAPERETLFNSPLNVNPPHISTDKAVNYDYDIVYVRTPRKDDKARTHFAEIAHPALMDAGADLMLLHPDGKEEVLVDGGNGSVTDPYVSFDGEWVYYSHFHGLKGINPVTETPLQGADIYKIHVKTARSSG